MAVFFRLLHHHVCAFNERRWWGYLRVCRVPISPVRQPRHLLLPLVWRRGERFITEIGGYTMPSTTTPEQSRQDAINHLRWQAKAIANLLSAVHLLPAHDQQTTLDTTTRLADELACEMAALTRGAE